VSVIPFPAAAKIRRIQWSLDRPAQVNRSAYTGARRVVANPWHGKWSARVELSTIVGEANVLAWRGFLALLKGQINTFQLPATEGPQNGNSGVTVSVSAAQGATSVTLAGAATNLTTGQFITINGQLLLVTNGGASTIQFEPPLRAAAPATTGVETARPYATVALSDSAFAWSVDPGKQYGISFDVEEAF
jgi:hypothetical protein